MTNIDATRQPGEPFHGGAGANASVWYRWTPRTSGPVLLSTRGSTNTTLLAVYTGDRVDGLHRDGASGIFLNAVAGTTYWITTDGGGWSDVRPGGVGHVELDLSRP